MRALILIGICALAACQRAPVGVPVDESRISVHAVLVAGSDSASVFVSRARASGDWQGTSTEPVDNAVVGLVHRGDTVPLATRRLCARNDRIGAPNALPDRACYSGIIPGGVKTNETYELMVSIPGHERIEGSVRVPAPPVLHAPAAPIELRIGQTAPHAAVLVRWSAAADRLVQLKLVADRTDCEAIISEAGAFGGYLQLSRRGSDSVWVAAGIVNCQSGSPQRMGARLVVSAFDANYDRYMRESPNDVVRLDQATIGLTSGFGVLGAAASVSIPVTLVP